MKNWFTSLLLLLPLVGQAESPAATPITIEADRLEYNQQLGTSTYQGNVVMVRGALRLKADRVILHTVEKKLSRAVITGNPATMIQQASDTLEPIRAQAKRMDYQPKNQQMTLTGDAHLWRNGDEFSGEQIIYNTQTQLVKASGDKKKGSGRVRVILQPQDETGSEGEKP